MDKVYVVTEGDYSAYHIVAIFATMEEAKEFVGGAYHLEIEEFPFGPQPEGSFIRTYHVTMNAATGEQVGRFENFEQHPPRWAKAFQPGKYSFGGIPRVAGVSTISAEHAFKVAVEARQAYLRENPA